ncbi:hypothetical protein BKA83DRAFT_4490332 [Pisolithus microcarpus]|nr:hypothetical protein BKA83DRAFT_4490332 [Pisolithus microcarpus]
MAHFLASGTDHTQLPNIHETWNELLDGLAFLYLDLDPSKPENTYQSQFLLQLLTHTHLQPCIGCLDVPKLDTSALKEHSVKGTLPLSCAMLKCAIHLFQRGDLHINDQLSAHGKATARTPLKLQTSLLGSAALKEIVVSANALVAPIMDSLVAEDGSLPNDALTDDLLVSANQHMRYLVKHQHSASHIAAQSAV